MSKSLPVSYWLLPSTEDAAWLTTIIEDLATRHATPRFEPHVTLHLGVTGNERAALDALAPVAAAHPPVTLAAAHTGHSPARFRAVFIGLPTQPLHALAALLEARAPGDGSYQLDAHLSLVYAELPETERAALASRLNHTGRLIRFDAIAAVAPAVGGDFGDVEGWRVLGRAMLRGD